MKSVWNWNIYFRYILEFAMIIPGAIAGFLPVMAYLRIKPSRLIFCILTTIFVLIPAGAGVCAWMGLPTNTILLPMVLVLFFVFLSVLKLEWTKAFFAFFNGTMLAGWGTLMANYIFARAESENPISCFFPMTSVTAIALAMLAVGLYGRYFAIKTPFLFEISVLGKLWQWFFMLPMLFTIFFLWVMPVDASNILIGRVQHITILLWIGILIVVFAFYEFFWYVAGRLRNEEILKRENLLLVAEEERYRQLQQHIQDTKRLRHDFRQHLRVLSELAAADKFSEVKRYLEDCTDTVGREHEAFCDNPAVDAISAWYQETARKQHASVKWEYNLPDELPVSDNDFCMILGNLVENALRAIKELPEDKRLISVRCRMIGEKMLGMKIENRCKGRIVLKSDGLPVNNGGEHLGLKSVLSAVSRAGGNMVIDAEDGRFTVSILFPL